jgi:hypothetical protein
MAELNPHNARVIGLIDRDGELIHTMSDEGGAGDVFEVVINVGGADEVEVGTKFLIFDLGQELFDPGTKESLGHFEVVRGIGRVINVQTRMSTLITNRTKTVRIPKPVSSLANFINQGGDFVERDEPVAFKSPRIGDYARRV